MVFGWFKKKKPAADKPVVRPAAPTSAAAPAPAPKPTPSAPFAPAPAAPRPAAPPPASQAAPAAAAPAAASRPRAPWGPEDDVVANQAIGNLRNFLLNAVKTDRGIHAETLIVSAGGLTGYAAIHAVFEAYIKRGRATVGDMQAASTGKAIAEVKTNDGQTYYLGDLVNSFLVGSAGPASRPFFAWGYLAGIAINSGVPAQELPDINEMFQRAASTLGTPEFGMPRMLPNLKPLLTPRQAVDRLWPAARTLLSRTDGPGAQGRALDVEHWPIVCAVATQQLINQVKGVLDIKVALRIAMESAIYMSKIDPKTVPQQQQPRPATA
jgi:hypothetical protein